MEILFPYWRQQDAKAMRERYPQFQAKATLINVQLAGYWERDSTLVIQQIGFREALKNARLVRYWEGVLQPVSSLEKRFKLQIYYDPINHKAVPKVLVVEPEISHRTFPNHPHLYLDGSVCSFFPPDETWLADRDTVADLIDLTIIWLKSHIGWVENGFKKWPWEEAPHDLSEVKYNAPCPCGSGIKFKKCHKNIYKISLAEREKKIQREPEDLIIEN